MFETIDGQKIYYERTGEGEPLLLLHGWGCSTEIFDSIVPRLAQKYDVVVIDFPGHGQSFMPKEALSVGDYARITKSFMKKQNIMGCNVICHSFGGRVVIKLAGQQEDIFKKIVLCDAAGIRPKRTFTYYRKVYIYKFMKFLSRFRITNAILKLFGIDMQERIKNAGSEDYRALSQTMRATFSKVVNEDLTHYLKHIRNPSLLIWGTNDTDTPLWMAEKMEKLIPDSGLVKFEGAGHYSFLERMEEFLVIAQHFFDGGNE